jgi:hypothetical protein
MQEAGIPARSRIVSSVLPAPSIAQARNLHTAATRATAGRTPLRQSGQESADSWLHVGALYAYPRAKSIRRFMASFELETPPRRSIHRKQIANNFGSFRER